MSIKQNIGQEILKSRVVVSKLTTFLDHNSNALNIIRSVLENLDNTELAHFSSLEDLKSINPFLSHLDAEYCSITRPFDILTSELCFYDNQISFNKRASLLDNYMIIVASRILLEASLCHSNGANQIKRHLGVLWNILRKLTPFVLSKLTPVFI